jgi:hypothetical protein
MYKIFFFLFSLISITDVKAQDNSHYSISVNLGFANLNYKKVTNAFQTSFSLHLPSKSKITYIIGYGYLLGDWLEKDDRSANPQIFNYNTHLQQSQFNGLLTYPLLSTEKFKLNLNTGISLNFIKQSFVNNIYKKLLFPNYPKILVSESTFNKKFQIGSISSLEASLKFKRVVPGISLQYQIQKEYQFFSPSVFLSFKL